MSPLRVRVDDGYLINFQQFFTLRVDDRDQFHQEWQSKVRNANSRRALANNNTHSQHRYQPHHQPRAAIESEFMLLFIIYSIYIEKNLFSIHY